jgi:hypothetical protein
MLFGQKAIDKARKAKEAAKAAKEKAAEEARKAKEIEEREKGIAGNAQERQYLPVVPKGGRRTRRRSNTIRMKKSEYLREHHHLFRVLRNPTRRALNAELRKQQRELKERGLKG